MRAQASPEELRCVLEQVPLFCLFLNGSLRQVLLYTVTPTIHEIQCFFIGGSKFGVYLCRNADVQLRLAEGKGLNNCTLVVFKVFIILLSFLAHLSRRLISELIVYQSLRHPSSTRPQFQTSSPLNPLGQLNSNFIWRLLRTRERQFVQMVLITCPRWPPRPYMVKTL